MPILIPTPAPLAPYPTVNDALNITRTRINDMIQSIGGEMLTNTQPFTQIMTNSAWLKMRQFLGTLGCSRARKRVVLTGFPVVGSQDPGSECRLNWKYYFDGVSYLIPPATPVLPQDFIAPLEIRERQSSGFQATLTAGSRGFTRMQLSSTGENANWRKRPWNGWFDWRGDEIIMPGSTSTMDFELYYSAKLQSFNTIGDSDWTTQQIPFVDGESALAYYIGGEFGIGRGDTESWEQMGQQACRDIVNTTEVPLRQRFNVSRRGYGGGGRSGRDGFSGGF